MSSEELKPWQSKSNLQHGHTVDGKYSATYSSWQAMLARCRYSGRDNEARYAGKGIAVCERWKDFNNFLADMGERPAGKTLDRENGDDGYHPGNCRWATPCEQARNTKRNVLNFESAVEVAKLRLSGVSCAAISAQFGISESLPREIAKGRCWKDALAQAKSELELIQ